MNVTSMKEFYCISFLSAPTFNEVPVECLSSSKYGTKNIAIYFFDKTMFYKRIPFNLAARS